MKKYIVIGHLSFLCFLISCATSKTYAPSETSTTPRIGFLADEEIDVSFFDSRTKINQSLEVQNSIIDQLQKTYPDANFRKLDDSEYFSTPVNGKINIKINIAGYNAGFGVNSTSGIGSINGQPFVFSGVSDGEWNGLTGIAVLLYDYRSREARYTTKISDVESRPNVGGYSTARAALQASFQNVMNRLTSFIDQNLME